MLGGSRLWRHADFLKFWSGQTISVVGSEVTTLALPTLAILQFHASAVVVGLLVAVQRLPFAFMTLFIGVLADRVRRRPLMVMADTGRAVALASIPAAYALGVLALPQLFAVGLCIGVGNVVFDIAYLAYLPALVGHQDIVEANNKANTSFSFAVLVGPGMGGVLIQVIGAARAIGVNALSYVVSVVTLLWIREPEARPRLDGEGASFMTELREGVRLVFQHPLLRSLLAMMTSDAVAQQLAIPIFLVFFYRSLHLAPAEAGLVFAAFGVGSIAGSLVAARAVALLGLGRMMAVGIAGSAVAFVMIPFALFLPAVPWLVLTGLIDGVSITAMDIQQVSLRQEVTPHRLQGRMNATFRTLFWGVWPLANFLGGLLADRIGAAAVILIAGSLRVVPIGIVLLSPIGRLRSHAQVQAEAADAG